MAIKWKRVFMKLTETETMYTHMHTYVLTTCLAQFAMCTCVCVVAKGTVVVAMTSLVVAKALLVCLCTFNVITSITCDVHMLVNFIHLYEIFLPPFNLPV